MAVNNVGAQFEKEFRLVLSGGFEPKITRDILQKFHRAQNRIEDVGKCYVSAIQNLKEAPHKNGLACSHLTREDDKSFAPLDSVVQGRQRLVVFLGRKQKRRIRRDIEWVPLQIVKALVHKRRRLSAQIAERRT